MQSRYNCVTAILLTGLLSGTAWAVDQPGQNFLLKASELPPPHATPAVANNNADIPRPAGVMPMAPKGFKVSIFADHLVNARGLLTAPNGDVFLAERSAGKITLLRDSKGTGQADRRFTFIGGLSRPQGMALKDGYFYFSDQIAVWRVPYKPGQTAAGKPERLTIAPDLRNSGMHATRNLAIAPDGTVFVEMGSHDNVSEYQPGAKVFKVDARGNLVEYASGIRNPVGIAFYPGTSDLFVAVNERDGLGDNLPPDYFTYVKPGGFYGYPYSYAGKFPDPDLGSKRPDLVAKAITPDVLFPAHSAPTGLVFYTGSSFPAEYKGDAFVSLHGSWNTAEPHGYKVVRIPMKNGRAAGGYQNFLTGFWDGKSKNPPQAWGRPVGLAIAKDGSLLVADDVGQTVWKVTYTGKKMMQHPDRRGVIGAGLALAAGPAVAKDAGVTFALPDGAADCHHHIYDPRFPYNPNAVLKPPYATVGDYRALQKKLGTSRNVMVQPSTYGTNNACVLDVLAQLGENCRAVCVVNSRVGDDELKRLNAAGVRGVRVQFGLGNPVGADEVMPLAKRIAGMGWHIQCNMPAEQLVQMTPLLLSLPVPVIIDHLGRAVDDKGPQYAAVRKLLDSGHGWVKLSGAYLYGGGVPPDYTGASLAAKGYLKAAPERCVWGSDWPHPDATKKLNPVAMPDDVVLLNLLAQWAPDAKLRHRILVENPERFYGFDPAKRPKAN